MTHRLYINEYNEELVYQLSHNSLSGYFCTDESTEKVLVISGELEDLTKLSSLMYENDEEKIKSVIPSFITRKEAEQDCKKSCKEVHDLLQGEILKIINKHYDKTSYNFYSDPYYRTIMNAYDSIKDIYNDQSRA